MKEQFLELLSSVRALSWGYQQAHWISKNALFYQDHLLFERLYEGVDSEADLIAEKVMGITKDGANIGLLEVIKRAHKMLSSFPQNAKENSEMFKFMLAIEKEFVVYCTRCEADKTNSLGFKNLVADLADRSEGRMYLLQQRLISGEKNG
jgi:DNA-binding ferritin-like protein